MAKVSLVLTVLGSDRPGLVESIAQVVASYDANWVESRMAHLAGQFAGILRVEVDEKHADPLKKALADLKQQGLETVVHHDPVVPIPCDDPLMILHLVGQDRPGIVREITSVLAAHRVNVEELRTECISAPNSGQGLFRVTAQLRLPDAAANGPSESQLRQALEQLAADLMVDIELARPQSP